MTSKNQNLVWMDMEMTGLDPEKDVIIEIACLVTDSALNILEEGPCLVIHQPLRILRAMDQWNQTHHGKSGLIEAVKKSKIKLRDAEQQSLEFIKKYCKPGKSPLCGNSIHHDRRFLARYMPGIHKYLSYRLIDVSTIKELVRRWYPAHCNPPKKEGSHRALSDIRESIDELRYYQKYFFKAKRKKS